MEIIFGLFLVFLLCVLYFLPTIIAVAKKKQAQCGIAVVNIFLGWTFVGWVVALAWAACDDTPVYYQPQYQHYQPQYQPPQSQPLPPVPPTQYVEGTNTITLGL